MACAAKAGSGKPAAGRPPAGPAGESRLLLRVLMGQRISVALWLTKPYTYLSGFFTNFLRPVLDLIPEYTDILGEIFPKFNPSKGALP